MSINQEVNNSISTEVASALKPFLVYWKYLR